MDGTLAQVYAVRSDRCLSSRLVSPFSFATLCIIALRAVRAKGVSLLNACEERRW